MCNNCIERTVNSILGSKVIPARKPFRHSDACVVHGANVLIAQADFKALHPHVCTDCQGHGGTGGYDWSVGMGYFDACSACLEKNLCPWCKTTLPGEEGDGESCVACPWVMDSPGYTVIEECGCFLDAGDY